MCNAAAAALQIKLVDMVLWDVKIFEVGFLSKSNVRARLAARHCRTDTAQRDIQAVARATQCRAPIMLT